MSDKKVRTDLVKRQMLKKIGIGAAFTVPLMASFSKDGLVISEAHAARKKPPKKKK